MRALVLGMTDEDSVRRFHSVVGAGRVKRREPPADKPHWNATWRWECTRWADIEPILSRLLPYLGLRRSAKAKELLAHPATGPKRKTHCKRGHPLTGDNLYIWREKRACYTCIRLRDRGEI
jgi:hypothetical protein